MSKDDTHCFLGVFFPALFTGSVYSYYPFQFSLLQRSVHLSKPELLFCLPIIPQVLSMFCPIYVYSPPVSLFFLSIPSDQLLHTCISPAMHSLSDTYSLI